MAISTHRILASALAVAAGCTGNQSGSTTEQCAPLTTTTAKPPAGWNGSVFTIVMENHSAGEIFGNASAPYINKLAKDNAVARGYHDPYIHPSEPNYFWMVAGENFGILDDDDPKSHHIDSTSHLADQLELADLSWKSYQESMGEPCDLVAHGRYAPKHNPLVYFNDVNGWDGSAFHPEGRCNEHVVDYSQLDADIAANKVPKYVFITPNLDNDMHDGPVSLGDHWLSTEIPKIMASDAYKNGGVIFLLWDEGSSGTFGGSSDDPPFIAISPFAVPGLVSKTEYDTSSYLKTVQEILGVDVLPCVSDAANVKSMSELFTQPTAAHP